MKPTYSIEISDRKWRRVVITDPTGKTITIDGPDHSIPDCVNHTVALRAYLLATGKNAPDVYVRDGDVMRLRPDYADFAKEWDDFIVWKLENFPDLEINNQTDSSFVGTENGLTFVDAITK
jgi:hypothetical protein